jgi:hypothetical protein
MQDDEEPIEALVNSDDAIGWAEQMAKEDPDELTMRLLKSEPAAFGLGANVAKRTCDYLTQKGVSESLIAFVFSQICYAGALSIEIMRLGSAKLFEQYIKERDQEDSREQERF